MGTFPPLARPGMGLSKGTYVDLYTSVEGEILVDGSSASASVYDVFLQVTRILSDQPQEVEPVKCLHVE
jgi:hypothetical protein